MNWYTKPCPAPCLKSRGQAREHQLQLTKPAGALGQLEDIAENFAGWQGKVHPVLDQVGVRVFVGDHGVCAQGVSAYPAEVTAQMIANFLSGGAAISVLCQAAAANFAVVNMGTLQTLSPATGLINIDAAPGTADFTTEEAMTETTLQACLTAGREQVEKLDCQLFIAGEMGIGNTTAAAAIMAASLNLRADQVVGRGTGIDDETLKRKQAAVSKALALHADSLTEPLGILRCVGGLEIAAMAGACIRSAQLGIPILLDGFISTVAALAAIGINADVKPWLTAGHQSAEAAHGRLLETLSLQPILNLGMRLGEGSGAAIAVSIIRSALLLHNHMATFAAAGVANSR